MYTKKDREDHEKSIKSLNAQLAQQSEEIAVLKERIEVVLRHIEKAKSSKKAMIPKED